jgi:hypothetical protein
VDLVHLGLIDVGALGDGGVNEQVHDEVAAEHDAGQRMEPAEQEMVMADGRDGEIASGRGGGHLRGPFA